MTTPIDKIQVTADGVTYERGEMLIDALPLDRPFFEGITLMKRNEKGWAGYSLHPKYWEPGIVPRLNDSEFYAAIPIEHPNAGPVGKCGDVLKMDNNKQPYWATPGTYEVKDLTKAITPEWVEVFARIPLTSDNAFFTVEYQQQIKEATTRILAAQRVKIEWTSGTGEYEKDEHSEYVTVWRLDGSSPITDGGLTGWELEILIRTALRDGVKVWVLEGVANV